MQERGSVLWRIRYNIGSAIPILILLAMIKKLRGPHGSLRVNYMFHCGPLSWLEFNSNDKESYCLHDSGKKTLFTTQQLEIQLSVI